MDKINDYRKIVREIIEKYAAFRPSVGDVVAETIILEDQGHYELVHSGWSNGYRVHGSVIHIDIRGEKILIQHDGTEAGIANELVEAGVPKENIVLAFKPPSLRQYTGFALA